MEDVFTEKETMLLNHLVAVGCPEAMTVHIVLSLMFYEPALTEMLDFCGDNHNASQRELSESYSRIYSKYRTEIERAEEENEEMYRTEIEAEEETEETTEL